MRSFILITTIHFLTFFGHAQLDDSILHMIDSVFIDTDENHPGYMMAVIQEDEFLFEKGYGLATLEHKSPIDKNTSFNIASLSKQFTAAAVALLVLDDKIKLDDLVSDYLSDFPFAEDSTQVKHLIYMTSGINDYYYNERSNSTDWSSLNFFNVDTAIQASYGSGQLMYQPGTQWSYSNVNYMLLTKIVERVSGQTFSEFVKENIFQPMGMNDALVNDDIFQIIPNRAMGYNFRSTQETGWLIESGYLREQGSGFLQIHRNSPHYGGSGVYTSMNDFKSWISNFHTLEFGGQEFYDLMHRTEKFDHDKSNDAFGLVLDKIEGEDIVWYEGGDWGFSSFMVRFPRTQTSLICFSNLGTGNAKSKVWAVYDVLSKNGIINKL